MASVRKSSTTLNQNEISQLLDGLAQHCVEGCTLIC